MYQLDTPTRTGDSNLILFTIIFSLLILLITGMMFGWIIYMENLGALL